MIARYDSRNRLREPVRSSVARHRRSGTRSQVLLCALASLIMAASDVSATVAINAPWVRIGSGGTSADVYMELESSDTATLVSAHSDAAKSVAIRPAGVRSPFRTALTLPASTPVMLAPGSARLTLVQLKRPLKLGDQVPLTLVVRDADHNEVVIPISAEVRRRSPIDDERRAHSH